MPRSFGGSRGTSSAASSRPCSDNRKKAASLLGLDALSNNLASLYPPDDSFCEVLFDRYEECMNTKAIHYGASSCDSYREWMAPCGEWRKGL